MFTVDQDDDTGPVEGLFPQERDGRWFAVDLLRRIELAPVFDTEAAAAEVGRKCYVGEPFFGIPCVPLDTPVPRPQGVFWKPHSRGPIDLSPPQRIKRRVIQSRPGSRKS